MGVVCHVGLIHELPLTVLKGNTVVEPTFSVKLQKDFFFFTKYKGSTAAAKRKFRIIIIPVSEGPLYL